MSRITKFLKMYLPDDNDYYSVERDQNENFEKIDRKMEQWDTDKEPAILNKKSGFNLDKTDDYEYDRTDKLATGRALYKLWKALESKIKAIKLTWNSIQDKPETFPPDTHYHSQYASSSHTHDDRYYTQTKSDNRLNGLAGKKDGTFPLSSATKGNVYLLESTNKYYMCVKDYSSYYSISVPNENFIEMSVYENLNRLNNLDRKTSIKEIKNSRITAHNSYVEIPEDFQFAIVYFSIGYPNEVFSAVFVKGFNSKLTYYGEEKEIGLQLQGNKVYLIDKGHHWDANIEKIYYM
ncbi:hypothetical protein A2U07_07035 [Fusobacterium necrophorum subsp. funduliforme]|nr:hypothetical protein A2U07_07035 [Fusobacterium necrophorum subsp. funduliforme]